MTHDNPPLSTPHAFNWHEIARAMDVGDAGEWFVVVFRSTLRADADSATLYRADARAHIEAMDHGSLLAYCYGAPDRQRRNIATCVWSNREAARAASHRALHRDASKLAYTMYESFHLERWWVTKESGSRSFTFKPAV